MIRPSSQRTLCLRGRKIFGLLFQKTRRGFVRWVKVLGLIAGAASACWCEEIPDGGMSRFRPSIKVEETYATRASDVFGSRDNDDVLTRIIPRFELDYPWGRNRIGASYELGGYFFQRDKDQDFFTNLVGLFYERELTERLALRADWDYARVDVVPPDSSDTILQGQVKNLSRLRLSTELNYEITPRTAGAVKYLHREFDFNQSIPGEGLGTERRSALYIDNDWAQRALFERRGKRRRRTELEFNKLDTDQVTVKLRREVTPRLIVEGIGGAESVAFEGQPEVIDLLLEGRVFAELTPKDDLWASYRYQTNLNSVLFYKEAGIELGSFFINVVNGQLQVAADIDLRFRTVHIAGGEADNHLLSVGWNHELDKRTTLAVDGFYFYDAFRLAEDDRLKIQGAEVSLKRELTPRLVSEARCGILNDESGISGTFTVGFQYNWF